MLQYKNLLAATVILIAGLVFASPAVFAHGGEDGGMGCGNNSFNKANLSKEVSNRIDQIQDKYNDKAVPLKQKVNLLKTQEYNLTLNDKMDIEKLKEYRQQIRDTEGKLDDIKLDETAEINKLLPENQQLAYNTNNCGNGSGMMNNNGMMGNNAMGKNGAMMGNAMHGNGSMMEDRE